MNFGISSSHPPTVEWSELLPFFTQENEAFFWYCHPYWEALSKKTQKKIDLYDSVVYHGKELDSLVQCIDNIKDDLKIKNEEIHVVTGYQLESTSKERKTIIKIFNKQDLLTELDAMLELINLAKSKQMGFVFDGD